MIFAAGSRDDLQQDVGLVEDSEWQKGVQFGACREFCSVQTSSSTTDFAASCVSHTPRLLRLVVNTPLERVFISALLLLYILFLTTVIPTSTISSDDCHHAVQVWARRVRVNWRDSRASFVSICSPPDQVLLAQECTAYYG